MHFNNRLTRWQHGRPCSTAHYWNHVGRGHRAAPDHWPVHAEQDMLDRGTGAWLRGEGFDVQCPGNHPDFTANQGTQTPLSQRNIGAALGQSLAALVKHVTTDGDGRGSQGVDKAT